MKFNHNEAPDKISLGDVTFSHKTVLDGITMQVVDVKRHNANLPLFHLSQPRVVEFRRKLPGFFEGEVIPAPYVCGCKCCASLSILAVWPELLSDPKFWPNDEVPEGMKIRAQVMKSMLAARCSEVKRVKDRSPREFAAFLANANVLRLAMEFLIKWDAGSGIEYEQYIAQLAELGVKRAGI